MEEYYDSSDRESNSSDSALEIMFEGEDLFNDDIDGCTKLPVTTKMIDATLSEYSSDSLRSINSDSEEELSTGKKQTQPIFTELKDMKMMQWQPGLIFKSKDHFKDVVRTYAIHLGVGLKMMKNDNNRIRFKCKTGCEWEIYAAPMKDKDTWEVRTIIDKHTCCREFNNKLLSAKWLSKRIESKVRDNPNIQINKIVDKVKAKWVAGISRDKAVRAKAKATALVEGNDGDQYNNLNYYYGHLYNNFRKKYPSKNLKGLLWRASNATYEEEWVRVMQEINSISHGAYDHLISIDKTLWCKHAFSGLPRCDVVVNNMSEAFNRVILDMRDKPILTMCEDIRLYMMRRWVDIREKVDKQTNDVNPKVCKKIEEEAKHSGEWMPLWSNNKVFEVVRLPDKFIVDLNNWYCSCGKWRVSGLPCRHSISCMHYLNVDINLFVPDCFKKPVYSLCYKHIIWPTNGPNFLGNKGDTQILPPIRRRAPGRPKKKRRMEADEEKSQTRTSRKFGTVKCSKCGNRGHNKKSCKN